jgi:hypothetical protein
MRVSEEGCGVALGRCSERCDVATKRNLFTTYAEVFVLCQRIIEARYHDHIILSRLARMELGLK